MKGLWWGLLAGVVAGAVVAAVGLGIWWYVTRGADDAPRVTTPRSYVPRPPPEQAASRDPEVMRVIYLNREGALLRAGDDDSRQNRSSIVKNAGVERAEIPPFKGSYRQWRAIVECVRGHFEPYGVRVVERRPVERRYIMAVFGGEPDDVGRGDGHGHDHRVTGLAPFNGQPVGDAIVLVFSEALHRRVRKVCETAAMEIAHAYGLDHARHCRDLMSYMDPCGRRRFLDRAIPCGEHEDRPCKHGSATQNSHRRLLEFLGPAPSAAPTDNVADRARRRRR